MLTKVNAEHPRGKKKGTVTKTKTHREILNEDDGIVYVPVAFNVLHMEQNLFRSVKSVVL